MLSRAFELHPLDRLDPGSHDSSRRFRSPGHFFHHLKGTLSCTHRLPSVYLLRAIKPAKRERIMLVVTAANQCPL
jgi:hypothetical protein